MDDAIVKYYRKLLKTGFEHAGTIEGPTILVDAIAENIPICDQVGKDSLQLYINIREGLIEDVRYLCSCDPATNVALEILCILIKGKVLEELHMITMESFSQVLGSHSEDLLKKAKGLMELLNRGIVQYQTKVT